MLVVEGLTLALDGREVLRGVDLTVAPGRILAVVGESGSGKSLTALSILSLQPVGATRGGQVTLDGRSLHDLSERDLRRVRGCEVGMVFQEPMTALDPLASIGAQAAETARIHGRSGREARALAAAALARVGLPPEVVPASRRPHALSGGQRQRAALAAALALRPRFLIADEPTTALDPVAQAGILTLLRRLVDEGMGLLLVSHDLALAAGVADTVAVMQDGRVVEQGEPVGVFGAPQHPYTRALIAAARLPPAPPRPAATGPPVLEARGLVRRHGRGRAAATVLNGVSLSVREGEVVAVVGGSGAGKSTLLRMVLGLEPAQGGKALIGGTPVAGARGEAGAALRRLVQPVFQNPVSAFDPRWPVARLVGEPLHLERPLPGAAERQERAAAALARVGLGADALSRPAHAFSGGQLQRIALARALVIGPAALVLDEATSALDLPSRADVLALIADLRDREGLAVLLVSHDVGLVRAIADRVVVLDHGRVVEEGRTAQVLDAPRHAVTAALVAASPDLDTALRARRLQP